MGIKGLLQALKSIQHRKHISEYKDQRVAIDCYCWLHKAIYSCMDDFYVNINSDHYINYFITRIRQFESFGIKLVMVFDGANLPMKNQTDDDREKKRQNSLQKFEEYKKQGLIEKAKKHLVKSIDVTPLMVYKLIKVLRKLNIEYYVAPYEADAQLAYLARINYVNLVVTEDSDLLIYYCDRVLFQLDSNGWGFEISMKDLPLCKELNFSSFTEDMFIQTCILSGCDYIESINGIGLKTGHALISKYKDYKEVIRNLIINPKYIVPKDYEEGFEKAFLTFKLQLIYCPIKKKVIHLCDILKFKNLLEKYNDISFLGQNLEKEIVNKVVFGDIDPNSLMPFNDGEAEINDLGKIEVNGKENKSKNQASLNEYFPGLPKIKKNIKIQSKKKKMIEKYSKNDIYSNNKRKYSEIFENSILNSNYLKRKKYRNEQSNFKKTEEEIINLAFQEEDSCNILDQKNISSDFELDKIETKSNQAYLVKTNEKTVYYSSSFESGSINFEEYKYKEEPKKKITATSKEKRSAKKITFLERQPTPRKIFKIIKGKTVKTKPLKSIEIINLTKEKTVKGVCDFSSYYFKG